MERDAHRHGLAGQRVILVTHIGQNLPRIAVHMHRAVRRRIRVVIAHGIAAEGPDAGFTLRCAELIAAIKPDLPGQGIHLIERRVGCRTRIRIRNGGFGCFGAAAMVRMGVRCGHRGQFQRPRHLLATAVQAGMGHVRERRVPFVSGELAPRLGDLLAPDPGPGKAGDQEEGEHDGNPEPRGAMQRFHKAAPTPERGKQRLTPTAVAGPPHVKPGGNQDHPQGSRDFEHPIAGHAQHQVAMQVVHEIVPAGAARIDLQKRCVIGVDRNHVGHAVAIHTEHGRHIVAMRGKVCLQLPLWHRLDRCIGQR